MFDVAMVSCASCGATVEVEGIDRALEGTDESDFLVRACARHLMRECPRRFMGHEAFGAEARWNRQTLYGPERSHLEIAWTTGAWGMPFLIGNVPGFSNG